MILAPRRAIAALLNAACTEDTRYFLKCILAKRLPDGKVRMEATDGHMLLRYEDTSDDPKDFPVIHGHEHAAVPGEMMMMDAEALKKALAMAPRKSHLPVLANIAVTTTTVENVTRVFLSTSDLKTATTLETKPDGQFPDSAGKLFEVAAAARVPDCAGPRLRYHRAGDAVQRAGAERVGDGNLDGGPGGARGCPDGER